MLVKGATEVPVLYTGPELVIYSPADDLALEGDRPSAFIALSVDLYMFAMKFLSLLVVLKLIGPWEI